MGASDGLIELTRERKLCEKAENPREEQAVIGNKLVVKFSKVGFQDDDDNILVFHRRTHFHIGWFGTKERIENEKAEKIEKLAIVR